MSESQLNNNKSLIVGVWKLISFKLFLVSGDQSKVLLEPHGDKPMGLAIFTNSGYMSGTVQPPIESEGYGKQSWFDASDQRIAAAARHFSTYSGPYDLRYDGEELVLNCHVKVALNPAWVGTTEVRRNVKIIE
ncbi:hypothetical protein IFR05_016680 [Cadophora sp. M221]|nr:hypothetical protein IFR05_016680 [Cadophora sp. M221]